MDVKSKPGTRCPMEGKPRTYIGDTEAVSVPDTPYYLRLVAEGSLIAEEAAKQTEKRGGNKS